MSVESDSDVTEATRRLGDLGFWLESPFPARSNDSRLFVAARDQPTLRHFDPERISYWETGDSGRGHPVDLTRRTPVPFTHEFSWGKITLVDRLAVRNEFMTLGGTLNAIATAPDTTIAIFRSPGPVLSLGGHSQSADLVASDLGAFFGRMMVPIDFEPGVEQAISSASPMERYAAFVAYERRRFEAHPLLREEHPQHATIIVLEARRLERHELFAWAGGERLVKRLGLLEEAVG
jgi:hypothetical protein